MPAPKSPKKRKSTAKKNRKKVGGPSKSSSPLARKNKSRTGKKSKTGRKKVGGPKKK